MSSPKPRPPKPPRVNFSSKEAAAVAGVGEEKDVVRLHTFEAVYHSECSHAACGLPIVPGQKIVTVDRFSKEYQHASCHYGTPADDTSAEHTDYGTQAYSKPTKFQGTSLDQMGY